MAARIAPDDGGAKHKSLHHFVAQAPWDEAELLAAVRTLVLPKIEKQTLVRGWIIDDTGIPKKGKHSVAVARQYCGELGKQDNCQVAVTLSVASNHARLPIALRLYLPEGWANDTPCRKKAGIQKDIIVQTKPQIAFDQIRQAIQDSVPQGIVLADTRYGYDTAFRSGVTELELDYVVGIQGSTAVWAPGTEPLPAKAWSGQGRKPKLLRRDDEEWRDREFQRQVPRRVPIVGVIPVARRGEGRHRTVAAAFQRRAAVLEPGLSDAGRVRGPSAEREESGTRRATSASNGPGRRDTWGLRAPARCATVPQGARRAENNEG